MGHPAYYRYEIKIQGDTQTICEFDPAIAMRTTEAAERLDDALYSGAVNQRAEEESQEEIRDRIRMATYINPRLLIGVESKKAKVVIDRARRNERIFAAWHHRNQQAITDEQTAKEIRRIAEETDPVAAELWRLTTSAARAEEEADVILARCAALDARLAASAFWADCEAYWRHNALYASFVAFVEADEDWQEYAAWSEENDRAALSA